MNVVNVQEVERTLRLLVAEGSTFEIRALGNDRGRDITLSGFFTDPGKAAHEIGKSCSGMVGIYTTLNPVRPELYYRCADRIVPAKKGGTTSDHNVVRRARLLIDIDGVPVAGISASDLEHQAALDLAVEIETDLMRRGWPQPLRGDSGNGAHLDFAIDLPADDESLKLVESVLNAAQKRWGTTLGGVTLKIDATNKNAARITKIFGTPARKGDDLPGRPHRMSRILCAPERLDVVTREQLEAFAAEFAPQGQPTRPPQTQQRTNGTHQPLKTLDVSEWLAKNGLDVKSQSAWSGSSGPGTCYELAVCPRDSDHNRGEAYVVQHNSGAISAGCQHNSCTWDWAFLRGLYPDAKPAREPVRHHVAAEVTPPPDAPSSPPDPSSDTLPEIVISTDQKAVVDCAERAIWKVGNVFQRGGLLVHVVRDNSGPDWFKSPEGMAKVAALKSEHLRERIGAAARWRRISKTNHLEPAMVPPWVPKTLLERDHWSFPALQGISETPVLRVDGTIHDVPGYDSRSRIIYDPSGVQWPAVKTSPQRSDAVSALAELAEPFCDFPFVADSDRSAIVAYVLSVLARSAIAGNVPLFGISANTPGSGKGLGVELCSLIATGASASVMSQVSADDEMRKRLFAIAIAAPRMANIDNIDGDLGCPSLDAALTASAISDRVLGASEVRSIPLTTVFSATGNNLSYRGDLARRVVPIELDPKVESPEDRTGFKHEDVKAYVRQERPRLVVAALTMLRAFICAGLPRHGLPAKGSFEEWDRLIRGSIIWAGGADPLGGVERLRQRGDSSLERISTLLLAWEGMYGAMAVTVADALRKAPDGSDLREAMNAFGSRDRPINAQLIGTRLNKLRGRIVGGLSFEDDEDPTRSGVRKWKVVRRG